MSVYQWHDPYQSIVEVFHSFVILVVIINTHAYFDHTKWAFYSGKNDPKKDGILMDVYCDNQNTANSNSL